MIAIFLQPNRRKQLTYMSLDLEIWTHLLKLPLCCPAYLQHYVAYVLCSSLSLVYALYLSSLFGWTVLQAYIMVCTSYSRQLEFSPTSGVKPFFITKTKSRFICYAAGKRLSPLPKLSTLSRSFLSQMDQNNRKTRENRECQ